MMLKQRLPALESTRYILLIDFFKRRATEMYNRCDRKQGTAITKYAQSKIERLVFATA